MNNFIKQIIEEKFASKAQQRYFYAQANKGGKKGKKWAKWAKEFSDKTDFEELPDKVENENEELGEIVDKKGNYITKKTPLGLGRKSITAKKTTDKIVKTAGASMGIHGVHGTHTSLRYWAENKEQLKNLIENFIDEIDMGDALGYEETLKKDATRKQAYNYLTKKLGLSREETLERLKNMGYDEKLEDDRVRLIENPNKYIEEFIESILNKKTEDFDIVRNEKKEISEINPIIKRQLESLKTTLKDNNLSLEDVLEYLKTYE